MTTCIKIGKASWYNQGKVTASGERYNPLKNTAAHRSLSFGTYVVVTNKRTNKSVIVVINDRGPYKKGRIIDLSYNAAKTIGLVGVDSVTLEYVERN